MAGQRPAAPNPRGAHFLRDHALISQLVRASGACPGRLVLDLGAGHGAITTVLAASGARVIAVERDPQAVRGLRRRLARSPQVSVVAADLREIPLPRRQFLVVANIPFSVSTALLRKLAGDPSVPLRRRGADHRLGRGPRVHPRGAAERGAGLVGGALPDPDRAPGYAAELRAAAAGLRPRTCPSGRGRSPPRRPASGCCAACCRAAYRSPQRPAQQVLPGLAASGGPLPQPDHGALALAQVGGDPRAPAAWLTASQWHHLAMLLAGSR